METFCMLTADIDSNFTVTLNKQSCLKDRKIKEGDTDSEIMYCEF